VARVRPIGHEDRLSIVDHLDELRGRLIICAIALSVAFGFCFWQNQHLLNILNRALPAAPKTSPNHLNGSVKAQVNAGKQLTASGRRLLDAYPSLSPGDQKLYNNLGLTQLGKDLEITGKQLPSSTPQRLPITIGIGEPFTTTLTVAAYFALLITLPLVLYQAYAFVIPALNPHEKRVALPVMLVAPVLFIAGVLFAYFFVLPPAVHFLQGYNAQNFDIFVQAKTYYTFEIFTMAGIGLAFQLPLVLLALDRIGVINSRTLTKNWRYAVVIIAVIAAAMPGADPVSTGLEMLPLVILYLASIVLLKIADRRAARAAAAELSTIDDSLDPT
jgi:sec-independent protein translocase protein TatC